MDFPVSLQVYNPAIRPISGISKDEASQKGSEMRSYDIILPSTQGLGSCEEYFFVTLDGEQRKIHLHDYPTIYQFPWLYEAVVYQRLGCDSPRGICRMLQKVFAEHNVDATSLQMLELGAGSGIFAEHLKKALHIGKIYGLDIHEEARIAAYRERRDVYSGYYVADLTSLSTEVCAALSQQQFTFVGFASAASRKNHIPVAGIEQAWHFLEPDGWFLCHAGQAKPDDPDQACTYLHQWIKRKIEHQEFALMHREACFHRYSTSGEKIFYDVIIGVKKSIGG
jgi:hypothetical protein